ncbi:hypothetical protein VP01_905g9 [Puccinia sorghi]|uniref:Cytosolic endo-beta-N-acetylglucosaminidase TIM barrel domain-containing protein n=1 Tax=Puccinia sorghi TaxID=27349 RepID=A0A0L6U7P6_9BASI|nr:hypothetical protein VP01_905g9 [Puccinia sorghi]
MPLSNELATLTQPRCFDSLSQLRKLNLKTDHTPTTSHPRQHSQLVITHDFKGGYNENPFNRSYSFEWLCAVDLFIYHTRILGTLIFEHDDSFNDLQLLINGPQLDTQTNSKTKYYLSLNAPPISTYFADRLIDLAIHHQFHGWLINIEIDLLKVLGDLSLARQYAASIKIWLDYLRLQGQIRIGSDWEVSWYDSVSYFDGRLNWASMLRASDNLHYFSASSSIFLDYHWSPFHLTSSQTFVNRFIAEQRPLDASPPETLEKLNQSFQPSMDLKVASNQLKRSTLYGVDVFGRGCPYGGGFSSWRAAQEVLKAGFSVALFAPGWTWESDIFHQDRVNLEESDSQWWNLWWRDERYFWVGLLDSPASGTQDLLSCESPNAHLDSSRIASEAQLPQPRKGAGHSELPQHKPFLELFPVQHKEISPSFYTNWSLGSGHGIWVDGEYHLDAKNGIGEWSDMAMSFPKHDLSIRGGGVWGVHDGAVVQAGAARCELVGHAGWFGSGSVEVKEYAVAQPADGTVKCLWMNTTSVSCADGMECRLVWKPIDPGTTGLLGLVFQISNHPTSPTNPQKSFTVICPEGATEPAVVTSSLLPPSAIDLEAYNVKTSKLDEGWIETTCQLRTPPLSSSRAIIDRVGITAPSGTKLSHYLGQISLIPYSSPSTTMKPLEVVWQPSDLTQESMEMRSHHDEPAGFISKPGKLRWRDGVEGDNNNGTEEMLAWLMYMTKDGSGEYSDFMAHKDAKYSLMGVLKGVHDLDLVGFIPPTFPAPPPPPPPPAQPVHAGKARPAELWTVVFIGIGTHGRRVSHGCCPLL